MRIEGMDATNLSASQKPVEVKPDIKDMLPGQSAPIRELENKSISQMTDLEKSELPLSEKVVMEAIQKANNAILGVNRKFEFSIHQKTKEIMIKVLDSDTNEVIREIPPEKILDMVARMWEMAGILVDERR